ncbi:MAG TPA: beta-galactosidase [Candidatus Hydrogenedens sp.]|nr:beta-galactosidase [Candidatus Hydrogenedens sp.]HOL19930.1 beta-galactosidase [Candidatus Hydrogenedens sp.]HPP59482.1 beta-galactosidase [Candidatus Hydrogenedens sp.]
MDKWIIKNKDDVKIVIGIVLILISYPQFCFSSDVEFEVVHPEDTGEALINPGMGWVLHFYDNVPENYGSKLEPSDTVDDFPGLTVIYLRIAWSFLEPEEGKFNWSVLDTPAQRWIAKEKQIALRITCSETPIQWATPKWVYDVGAKGYFFTPLQGTKEDGTHWEPDYSDPIFLEKLDHFLQELAKRYDGNPEVAFIDIGSLGVWGEGHTWHSSQQKISVETVKKHIDLHVKHFKNTLIALNDDSITNGQKITELSPEQKEIIAYAKEKGLTLRDDSILVQGGEYAYMSAGIAQEFWKDKAVILESEHYGNSKTNGHWGDGTKYLQAVEEYHASYASIHWWPREFLQERKDLIDKMNLRLGYRILPTEIKWQKQVKISNNRWDVEYQFANKGVAPCYKGGFPIFTWKDDKGGIVATFVDDTFNVNTLPVSLPNEVQTIKRKATFLLPYLLKEGNYSVYVSIGTRTGTPVIQLPISNKDNEKRYLVGQVEVIP